jgi:hypothetical protein
MAGDFSVLSGNQDRDNMAGDFSVLSGNPGQGQHGWGLLCPLW